MATLEHGQILDRHPRAGFVGGLGAVEHAGDFLQDRTACMRYRMDVLHDITSVAAASNFTVRVTFDTGETGMFDCSPYLSHPYWKRLADPAFFRLVRVAYGTLAWPDDIDIAPEDVWEKTVRDPVPASPSTYPDITVSAPCVAESDEM